MKRDIKKFLDGLVQAGLCYYFMPVQTGFGASTLDFLICYKGRFFAIETKRPDKPSKMTARQEEIARRMRLAGGVVIVARDVELVKALMVD
ncbi:MAG: hypothetical protein KGI52_17535 [Burkholderiales bacterium]|nr:hypothetical protein [Burkholderiales bacterium]